ncbi:alpha/beta hydrolase [Gordonia sp. HY002]|uniref:alpha/beta fold hydrolase n=1 Tax=Gordonia zhenghanii TaxID=2911516 RepID=UPI001EF102C4|nr:alpha/beta hydrolase [Gordonia zhenghanii]MCF8569465.1 alpha/beta hydrolase [Gordonia zhenghanii]MCF8602364.1 alpha/beta hydrolase [Gordonia zhenghanii]
MIVESRRRFGDIDTRTLAVGGGSATFVPFHGFGDSADTWRGVLTRLEQAGHTAVAFDMPGFGVTQPLTADPVMPQWDCFVDDVIDEYGEVAVVGNSLGAAAAIRAAARRPDRVSTVVAVDDPFLADHRPMRLAQSRALELVACSPILDRLPLSLVQALIRATVPGLIYHRRAHVERSVVDRWVASVDSSAVLCQYADLVHRIACEAKAWHPTAAVECPTLVVHGAHDRLIPTSASVALHARVPGSELAVHAQAGHCPQLEYPDWLARTMLEFLGRQIAGDPEAVS